MKIQAIKTKIFLKNQNIYEFIISSLKNHILKNEDILVVTSKIVALSEGRVIEYSKKTSKKDIEKLKEKLIKEESEFSLKTKYTWLTIKDGIVMASAGIDESNANNSLILLPKDSFLAAQKIRVYMMKHFNIKKLGVIITDSRTAPLRAGITGQAIGYAGFKGIKSYLRSKDIFGRGFKFSRVDVADSLAAGAVYEMGEGNEQKPLAIINDVKVKFCSEVNKKELNISIEDDMYRPMFKA